MDTDQQSQNFQRSLGLLLYMGFKYEPHVTKNCLSDIHVFPKRLACAFELKGDIVWLDSNGLVFDEGGVSEHYCQPEQSTTLIRAASQQRILAQDSTDIKFNWDSIPIAGDNLSFSTIPRLLSRKLKFKSIDTVSIVSI
ncbi:hypothetical protein [Neptuniibacter sp. QD37_11]|uniref:hypothetical protein n=1 Tax=Neptuniibacter sp. QD37_11 TaxID=3398209 RepID=UPI0039F4C343